MPCPTPLRRASMCAAEAPENTSPRADTAAGVAASVREPAALSRPSKVCAHCGGTFHRPTRISDANWWKRRFCGPACKFAGQKRTYPPKPCACCGEMIHRRPGYSDKVWDKTRFCSTKCGAKARWFSRAKNNSNGRLVPAPVPGEDRQALAEQRRAMLDGAPRFSTAEEWLAFHGVETARAGLVHYSAANDPNSGVPVRPTRARHYG